MVGGLPDRSLSVGSDDPVAPRALGLIERGICTPDQSLWAVLYTTPWRDMTRVAAKAVGREEEGEKLIEQTEAPLRGLPQGAP